MPTTEELPKTNAELNAELKARVEKTIDAFTQDVKAVFLKHEIGLLLAGLAGGFEFCLGRGNITQLTVKWDEIEVSGDSWEKS